MFSILNSSPGFKKKPESRQSDVTFSFILCFNHKEALKKILQPIHALQCYQERWMATPHLAISVIDLRALRRIYCRGVPRSLCREGNLKKLEWYIFPVIAALATMSHLSSCSDSQIRMPVSPSVVLGFRLRGRPGGEGAEAERREQAQGFRTRRRT